MDFVNKLDTVKLPHPSEYLTLSPQTMGKVKKNFMVRDGSYCLIARSILMARCSASTHFAPLHLFELSRGDVASCGVCTEEMVTGVLSFPSFAKCNARSEYFRPHQCPDITLYPPLIQPAWHSL